jgi:hypothetical protein
MERISVMAEWTEGAKSEWKKYCDQLRRSLTGSGADANEVLEDILRDINTRLADVGAKVVTEIEMRKLLTQFGLPEDTNTKEQIVEVAFPAHKAFEGTSEKTSTLARIYPLFFILAYGIILLALTLFVTPRFLVIYADLGTEIPLLTKIIFNRWLTVFLYLPLFILAVVRLTNINHKPGGWYIICIHVTGIILISFVVVGLFAGFFLLTNII